jgi:hypothetical protein
MQKAKKKKPILVGDPKESLLPFCATAQIREFLGAAGFCWIWIPNYSLLAKLFYKTTKRGEQKPTVQEKSKKKKKRPLKN